MHTPVSRRRARSIASRNVWTNPTSTRSEFVCSIANATPAARASFSTGVERVGERVGRLFPRERRERSRREHDDARADRRARCRSSARGGRVGLPNAPDRASWNGPSPMRSTTCSPSPTASATSAVPSSQPNASSLATETPDVGDAVPRPEGEVLGKCELERGDRARRRPAGASISPRSRPRAMLLPPSSWRLMPVTNSDSRLAR